LCPGFRGSTLAFAHGGRIAQRHVGRDVEGAKHGSDVAQAAALAAALGKRLVRVLPEVDRGEVLAGPEHVSKVVVAVDPRALRGEAAAQEGLEAGIEVLLAREKLLGQLRGTPVQAGAAKLPEHLAREI